MRWRRERFRPISRTFRFRGPDGRSRHKWTIRLPRPMQLSSHVQHGRLDSGLVEERVARVVRAFDRPDGPGLSVGVLSENRVVAS